MYTLLNVLKKWSMALLYRQGTRPATVSAKHKGSRIHRNALAL